MKQYCTSEEDIETLFTYFQAAINGEENKESLKRLFDLQCGVMRSHPYQSERDKVLDKVEKAISHCPDRSFCLQKIEKLRQAGSP